MCETKISHYLPTRRETLAGRQSSRCRLDSDCFPLSLVSVTGDPHLLGLSAAWSVETNASKTKKPRSQSVLPMVSHGDICSAGNGYASTWYFGTDYCSAPHSQVPISLSAASIWCSPCFFFRVSLSKQPFIPGLANHTGATAQNWRTCTTTADPLDRVTCERTLLARFERPHITRRLVLSVSALTRALPFPSWRASALI